MTGATRWRTGASVSNTVGSPMLAGSVLYAATTEDQVLALDAAAGARIWDAELNGGRGSGFYSWPTVAEGKFLHTGRCRRHGLYFGSRDGNGYALDAAIGAQRWQVQYGTNILASIQSSPAVVGGTVYIGTNNNGRVLALNAVTAPPCGVSARQARCWRVPAPADARRRAG